MADPKSKKPAVGNSRRVWLPKRSMGLARALMKSGYATRARAVEMVAAGRVRVGGVVVTDPRHNVDADTEIFLDGNPLQVIDLRYFAFNKPLRVLCRASETPGRKCVHDYFPPEVIGLQTAGRMDANTSGLLLLSNDRRWNNLVTAAGLEQEYRVQVDGELTDLEITVITAGIILPGLETFKPDAINLIEVMQGRTVMTVTVRGGQVRSLRRMFSALRHKVGLVRRIRVGEVRLGDLSVGQMRALTRKEIASAVAASGARPGGKPAKPTRRGR